MKSSTFCRGNWHTKPLQELEQRVAQRHGALERLLVEVVAGTEAWVVAVFGVGSGHVQVRDQVPLVGFEAPPRNSRCTERKGRTSTMSSVEPILSLALLEDRSRLVANRLRTNQRPY